MPLTDFQRTVLRLLAEQRTPESFVAGGTAINVSPWSLRYSEDVDIFHDAEGKVVAAADADSALLVEHGFEVVRLMDRTAFQRAMVSRGAEHLRLEWVQDSAFRFFPAQQDDQFGWRLHLADLATNKILALAGRWEARDFVDALYLDDTFASLGLLAWAAASKDPGLTPMLILEQANRFNRLRPEELQKVLGAVPLDLVKMKTRWRECVEAGRELVMKLPVEELGALYLNANGQPANPLTTTGARPHYASLGGVWPHLAGDPAPLPDAVRDQADQQARQRYGRD